MDLNMPSTDCVALAVANQIGSGRLFTTRISRKSDPCARSVSLKRARGQIESVARELCAAQTQLMGAGVGGKRVGVLGGEGYRGLFRVCTCF